MMNEDKQPVNSVNQLSEKLLLAVKMQAPTEEIVSALTNLNLPRLQEKLKNDGFKKAFWINIYNAFYQMLRKDGYDKKAKIYTQKLIRIAHVNWSLDDIEHGLLRRYRSKYSFGYLPQLFASKLIKELAVTKIDYRIHFALNCGAKSCPPIAFYSAEKIDAQLELATLSFLESETEQDEELREVRVNRILLWFMADFGGKKGIRKILKKKLQIDTTGFKLVFKFYSRDELLDNYSE